MPLDADPVETGNIAVEVVAGVTYARVADPTHTGHHVSHFATCPSAREHRRRR